jgi:hypothetical protein
MGAIKSLSQIERDGGVCIGTWHDGWKLYALPKPEGSKWQPVRIRRPGKKRQGFIRSVNLGWNGERFADGGKAVNAPQALIVWAAEQMRGHPTPTEGGRA